MPSSASYAVWSLVISERFFAGYSWLEVKDKKKKCT